MGLFGWLLGSVTFNVFNREGTRLRRCHCLSLGCFFRCCHQTCCLFFQHDVQCYITCGRFYSPRDLQESCIWWTCLRALGQKIHDSQCELSQWNPKSIHVSIVFCVVEIKIIIIVVSCKVVPGKSNHQQVSSYKDLSHCSPLVNVLLRRCVFFGLVFAW